MYVLSNSVWKQLSQFPWSLSVCKVQRGFSYSNTSRCLPMFQLCFHQIMPKILNAWCCCNRIASSCFQKYAYSLSLLYSFNGGTWFNFLRIELSWTSVTKMHFVMGLIICCHYDYLLMNIFEKIWKRIFTLAPSHPIPAQTQTLFHNGSRWSCS